MKTLICNAQIVNEGVIKTQDLLIEKGRITKIANSITHNNSMQLIDANGDFLIPGMIDDQVHFREPGLTHKGNIASESRAAVAGGITSFMEMPNVNPQTTNADALNDKYIRASKSSVANFSFYMGATNSNIEEIKKLDPHAACGVKVFMGSSTGDMLVDNQNVLNEIFKHSPILIATHCESTPIIAKNEAKYRAKYGEDIPMFEHPNIRSRDACFESSTLASKLAIKHGAKLHILHVTTADELAIFPQKLPNVLSEANITAEVCVHHLFFNSNDYDRLGTLIKCNPAIKTRNDQLALIDAVNNNLIDIIATDHAPHTFDEKQNSYFKAPSGLPLVQHALLALLDMYNAELFSLETIVQKTSHNVALRFDLKDRGFIREGYFADLAQITKKDQIITADNVRYGCKWSPFLDHKFSHSIKNTWVNGMHLFDGFEVKSILGTKLEFNR